MKKQRDTASTRAALMRTAAELFAEHGFEGATVERIARKARVNKAMISYHFGGKRQLYQALLAQVFVEMGRRMEGIRQSDDLPEARLARFVEEFRSLSRENPAMPRMMIREAIAGGRNLDQRAFPYFMQVFQLLSEIVEQGVRLGRFRPVNPLLVHVGLVGSMVFYLSTGPFRQRILDALPIPAGSIDDDEFFRHWGEAVWRGLTIDGPAGRPQES